jgi:hypothetical protein
MKKSSRGTASSREESTAHGAHGAPFLLPFTLTLTDFDLCEFWSETMNMKNSELVMTNSDHIIFDTS